MPGWPKFYPCNNRESEILFGLDDELREMYEDLRNRGLSVDEALEQVRNHERIES